MRVVIDISEDLYNRIFKGLIALNSDDICELRESVEFSIRHGKVLPKAHGRLIDADELRSNAIKHKYSNNFCEEHNIDWSINLGMLNILIADAHTFIEAESEVT